MGGITHIMGCCCEPNPCTNCGADTDSTVIVSGVAGDCVNKEACCKDVEGTYTFDHFDASEGGCYWYWLYTSLSTGATYQLGLYYNATLKTFSHLHLFCIDAGSQGCATVEWFTKYYPNASCAGGQLALDDDMVSYWVCVGCTCHATLVQP